MTEVEVKYPAAMAETEAEVEYSVAMADVVMVKAEGECRLAMAVKVEAEAEYPAARVVDALLSGPRWALQLGLSARAGTRAQNKARA